MDAFLRYKSAWSRCRSFLPQSKSTQSLHLAVATALVASHDRHVLISKSTSSWGIFPVSSPRLLDSRLDPLERKTMCLSARRH